MCLLQGLLEVRAAVFTSVRHKINNRPVVALYDNAVGAEGGVMFGGK